jgi:hypothetical protein
MSAIYENSSTQTDEGVTETVNAESTHTLCENTDCERYPDDEDFDKDNEEEYEENGEWKKCALCDGYFVDDDDESDDEAKEDAYMEEVKKLQKKYNIKTDKDGVIILPMGSAD